MLGLDWGGPGILAGVRCVRNVLAEGADPGHSEEITALSWFVNVYLTRRWIILEAKFRVTVWKLNRKTEIPA